MATSQITASCVEGGVPLDAAHPAPAWEHAEPIRFSTEWQGKNPHPELETEVRVLWSPEMLYLRFVCRYREIFVFEDSDPSGRRDHLWDRDVAEAFLQPPEPVRHGSGGDGTGALTRAPKSYKEFEVAPNGMWIDLDILPGGRADLKSGLTRSVHLDEAQKLWTAELAIPMKSLTSH